MDIEQRQLEIYRTKEGKVPFSEWLNGLRNPVSISRVRIYLDRLSLGNVGSCRSLGDGLFELKIRFGPGFRVYFGNIGSKIILLLSGGDKSSQKKDILKARSYLEDYRS